MSDSSNKSVGCGAIVVFLAILGLIMGKCESCSANKMGKDAVRLYNEQRYEESIQKFKEANDKYTDIKHNAVYLYYWASALEKAGNKSGSKNKMIDAWNEYVENKEKYKNADYKVIEGLNEFKRKQEEAEKAAILKQRKETYAYGWQQGEALISYGVMFKPYSSVNAYIREVGSSTAYGDLDKNGISRDLLVVVLNGFNDRQCNRSYEKNLNSQELVGR